jgi:hypothetical protein
MAAANTSEKDFLAEIAALAAETRRDIEAHKIGLDPSKEAIRERRKRVLNGDFEFFAYTYLPHHIRPPSSLFHKHVFKRLPQILMQWAGAKEWWVAPRGEAKSSILTKVGPVFVSVIALLQRPDVRNEIGWTKDIPFFVDYIIMLGAETKLPTKLLEVVKVELTSNAALALDFPEVCGVTKNWKIGEFTTKTGVKCEAFGAEQAIRGTFHGSGRPKLLLGDDLITDKEAKSPTECENRWDWLEKAIDYLGPPEGNVKFLGVGTVLNKNDPISKAKAAIGHLVHHFRAIVKLPTHMDLWAECQELMLNKDKIAEQEASAKGKVLTDADLPSFKFYQANKKKMDEGSEISWPQVRSLYWLMRQRAKNAKAFGTEMQGEPRSDEDKVFSPITYFVNILSHWLEFGGIDPSMGRGETSDPSAILGGAWCVEKSKLHVHTAEIKRRVPSKLYADIIQFQRDHRCQAIGFENNNAYEAMRLRVREIGMEKGMAVPLIGLTATIEQEVRTDSLEPWITDPLDTRIEFSSALTLLLAELDSWPEKQPGHHYDGLSALYWLWIIAYTRGNGIGTLRSTGRRESVSSTAGFM